jgi:hypothetical protein
MAEAADNYPDDVESPYVPLEPELAVSSARKFINAISRIAIDRTDLF